MPDDPSNDRSLTIYDEPTGDVLDYLVIGETQSLITAANASFFGLEYVQNIRSVHVIEPSGCLLEVGIEAVGPGHSHGFEIYVEGDRTAVIERFQLKDDGTIVFDDVFVDGFPAE